MQGQKPVCVADLTDAGQRAILDESIYRLAEQSTTTMIRLFMERVRDSGVCTCSTSLSHASSILTGNMLRFAAAMTSKAVEEANGDALDESQKHSLGQAMFDRFLTCINEVLKERGIPTGTVANLNGDHN